MTTKELETMAVLISRFRQLCSDEGSVGEKADNRLADRCHKALVKQLARNKKHNAWRYRDKMEVKDENAINNI